MPLVGLIAVPVASLETIQGGEKGDGTDMRA